MPEHANNNLKIDGDIIFITLSGFQSKEAIALLRTSVSALVAQQRALGKPILIAADITKVTDHDSEVLIEAREFMKEDFDASAVFGATITYRMIANWLIKRTGQEQRIQVCDDRRSAMAWLKKFRKQ